MKIIVLMEDTCGHPDCAYEHGLSLYIETERHRILLDTGASGKTWENAHRLGVDLSKVDTVILSHGHYDHSGGLLAFRAYNEDAVIYMQRTALLDYYHGDRYIGIDKQIGQMPHVTLLEGDVKIDHELSLFTGITGRRFWPQSNIGLSVRTDREILHKVDELIQDQFAHEQCLVIRGEKNLLLSGCAHNGILNILDRYREIYGGSPDIVISGFHMMKKADYTQEEAEIIQKTAEELRGTNTIFYTGHCTGQQAIDLMQPILGEHLIQIHSGMVMNI